MKAPKLAVLIFIMSSVALAGEGLTAEQLWAHRAELDKKVVRASFGWHYNFEACDAHVEMPDGTVRNLAIKFDGTQLQRSAPAEWKKVEDAFREYWKQIRIATDMKTNAPADIWFAIEADVEVSLPAPQKDKDSIVLSPDLFLKIIALHSVRDARGKEPKQPPS